MAGTMVHLAVAMELDQRIGKKREVYLGKYAQEYHFDRFVAGNICPDGIMARKNYERSMKLHTHMRDGIPDGTFQEEEKLALFRKRLKKFFQDNLQKPGRDFSLYLGYLTHMMTDEKFILELHAKVLERIEQETGLTKRDRETFEKFGRDVDAIDFRLVAEYPGMSRVYEALRYVRPYEIADMITEEELTDSRNWILHYFFETPHGLWEPEFLSYETMREFIPVAAEEICKRLPEYLL